VSQRGAPSAPVLAIVAVIVAAGVWLTWLASHLWFMLDDWAFLLHRKVTLTGDESLLKPHNDHWVTLPILVFRLLFHLVGMHHYLPYALVTIGLHLAVAALLAVMLWRAGAHPWVVVLMTGIIAFFGPGGLNILWDFQMVFIAPAALALLCLLLVDRGETMPRFPVAVWLLLAAALLCSGAGVTMVAWVAAYTWLRRGFRHAIVVALPPTVMYAAWFLAYGRGTSPAPPAPPGRIVPFILRGMTNLWDKVVPIHWLGVVVLVVIVLVTVLHRGHPRLRVFAGAGLMALFFNYLLLAVTRAGWGVQSSTSTRYLYVGVLLTLPAVGLSLNLLWERMAAYPLPRTLVWLALGVVFIGSGAALLHRAEVLNRSWTVGMRGRVVAATDLVHQGVPLLNTHAEPDAAPDIDTASLARPDIRSRLPHFEPSLYSKLGAAGFLQVAVSEDPLDLPVAEGVTVRKMKAVSGDPDACQVYDARAGATVEVPGTAAGAEVRLRVSQDTILTQLRQDETTGLRWSHPVHPDTELHVGSTAADSVLRVTVPSGEVTLCTGGTVSHGG
jgi:hypothetical protein